MKAIFAAAALAALAVPAGAQTVTLKFAAWAPPITEMRELGQE